MLKFNTKDQGSCPNQPLICYCCFKRSSKGGVLSFYFFMKNLYFHICFKSIKMTWHNLNRFSFHNLIFKKFWISPKKITGSRILTFSFFFHSRCCHLRVSLAFPGTETSALIAPARKRTEIGKKNKTGLKQVLGLG